MFDECIYFNLSALTRKVTRIWEEEFGKLGLSPSHGYLLFAIAENPDASQKELGEIMELDPSTVTRFIDTLVSKGLAKKPVRGRSGDPSHIRRKEGVQTNKEIDGRPLYEDEGPFRT